MKKIVKIFSLVLLTLFCVLVIYIIIDPELPNQTNAVITNITNGSIPELVDGDSGYVNSGTTKIWYEIKNKSTTTNTKGTVLLINGYTEPSTLWNQFLIKTIIDSGYQVIRFDNRDVGLSDWTDTEHSNYTYTMKDMVDDAMAVLDQNGISKAHLVGYSMGGYIAQRIAIEYPNRVLSLTSLSSTADFNDNHPEYNWTPPAVIKLAIRNALLKDDKSLLKLYFKVLYDVNGNDTYHMELKLLGEQVLYEQHKRRGVNKDAGIHQGFAIKNAESNYAELDKLKMATLIVHGKKDPILSFELAKKYSEKIENSKKIWINEAGHLITNDYVEQFRHEFIKMLSENQ
ncbi:MAG: alpha/beta hydrolase [Flavobacteriaceae bacterium]|nr:alpha/beta hydrolase [Flavobacteriaceae bacterium]